MWSDRAETRLNVTQQYCRLMSQLGLHCWRNHQSRPMSSLTLGPARSLRLNWISQTWGQFIPVESLRFKGALRGDTRIQPIFHHILLHHYPCLSLIWHWSVLISWCLSWGQYKRLIIQTKFHRKYMLQPMPLPKSLHAYNVCSSSSHSL